MYGVLTSDAELNALGVGEGHADSAQVLFTTQQRIEKHLDGGSFESADEFFYQSRPRAVRIWDESWLPGQGLIVNRDEFGFLFQPLRPAYPELAAILDGLFYELLNAEDGHRFELPDFVEDTGVELNDVLRLLETERDNLERSLREDQRTALSALWFLSGKTVTVRRDGKYGATMLDYRETLPEDLAPLLVTDASGRVRETYAEMEKGKSNIQRLTAAPKKYDRLTVHVWRRGGGKSGWHKNGQELADGIASTINSKPAEEWLIVIHRPDSRVGKIEDRIRSLVSADQDKLHFIPWGRHMATNAYSLVKNVILAGTLFYRPSFYEALGRLSAGFRSKQGTYPLRDAKRIELGESRHGVLQASCRGSVRLSDGVNCHPCELYLIASPRSGIPAAMPDIFPDCKVVPWTPVKRALRGKVKEAVEYVQTRIGSGEEYVPFKDIKKVLGITDNSNFRTDVRLHSDFRAEMDDLGLIEWGKGQRFTGLRVSDASLFGLFADD